MRTLKFIVDDQIIRRDPNCNFDDLIPGTEGYLRAEFIFSREWNSYVKVATFWSLMGKEYPPQVLEDGKTCYIPAEALKKRIFKIQVVGKRDEVRLVTNKITVVQNGGNT